MTTTNTAEQTTLTVRGPHKPKALEVMASRMNVEPLKLLQTLKNTVFKGATDDELLTLVVVANEYNLSPLLKELYAFPKRGGGIVPIVSVDGWNKMTNRAVNFDGIEFEFAEGDNGKPVSCTATIYLKDRSHPVKITEFYGECYRNTDPWNQMPRRMLRHKALIQASRVAFGFSGVYDEDEGRDQADTARIEAAKPVFNQGEPKSFLQAPATPPTEAQADAPVEPQQHPTEEPPQDTPEASKPPTEAPVKQDGDKTRRINAVCQANKISLGDALRWCGEAGHASFEEIPEDFLRAIEKRPAVWVKSVRGES